jgi:hypothetical protein
MYRGMVEWNMIKDWGEIERFKFTSLLGTNRCKTKLENTTHWWRDPNTFIAFIPF